MGKGMNTLKPIKDATTSFSRSVLGTLLFAFGLFLCSSFSAQAHIDNDVSRQFEALLEAAPSADVFKAQHSELEGNDIGPQLQRFDAVDEDSALVEASSGWRQLDAALARSERNLFASISETLNGNISQTTARTPKSVTDKPLPHSSGYAAALASAPAADFRHPGGAAHRHAPLLPSRRTRARLLPHASSIRLLELPLFRPSLSA